MSVKTVLRGGTLIDGTDAPPVPDGAMRIEDGKIVAVGAAADFGESASEGAEVIDVSGQTIMPGLINCHEHLDLHHSYGSYMERVAQPTTYWLARAFRNALLALREGVTTVRDLGSKEGDSVHLKKAINDGMILGPRVLTCNIPIAMTGGYAWYACIEADGVDGMRKAVRQLLKSGADLIKCMASGGLLVEGSNLSWSLQFTVEEMRAAFDEAHKAGKLTTVHCSPPQAIQWAVEAGVDCIEHGTLLDQATAELLARKGVALVPTLGESWVIGERGEEHGRPHWLIEMARARLEDVRRSFGYAVEAGVKIVVGTDTSDTMAEEMQLMVEKGGMSPMKVLVAATRDAAEVCGLSEQTGTLEAGKWADVIVLDGNPLDDLTALSRVKLVFKEGVLYQPEALTGAIGRHPL